MHRSRSLPIALGLLAWMVSCVPGGCGCNSSQVAVRDSTHPPPGDNGQPGEGPRDTARPEGAPTEIPDSVTYSGSFPAGIGALTAELTVSGAKRKVALFVPSSRPAHGPLLITLHGTNGAGDNMISSSAADALARKEGVVVASPWARFMTGGDWDNHSGSETYWQTYPNTDPNSNADLLLVRAIIKEARRVFGIDTRRVVVLGHSNGGFFAITAAMALPDRIAAFAANASGLVRCPTTGSCKFVGTGTSCAGFASQTGYCSCNGEEKPIAVPTRGRKVPGYLSHAANDPTVSVYYSCELANLMLGLGYPTSVALTATGEHGMPYPYAEQAWGFLSEHSLP